MRAFFTRNPPLYGAILGLLAPRSLAPESLVHIAQVAVIGILPIGFFAVGATLAEDAHEGTLPIPPPFTRPSRWRWSPAWSSPRRCSPLWRRR